MHANESARRAVHRRAVGAGWLGVLVLGGCAGGADALRQRPDQETVARLAAAEKAWRAGSPDYPALREELRGDPVAAAWLTRMFVSEVVRAREAGAVGEELTFAATAQDPRALQRELRAAVDDFGPRGDFGYLAARDRAPDRRAIAEIAALGAAAVPVLVEEWLLGDQVHQRQYGVELLGYVGRPALPAVLAASRSGEARDRRAAARALGQLPDEPEALARLTQLAREPDFTVRADAARGLRHGGAEAGGLLREMVQQDGDPFVQRTAAAALVGHPGRRTAEALVAYLARCQRDVDTRGYEAAQATLQELADARGPRTIEAWRRWASTQRE